MSIVPLWGRIDVARPFQFNVGNFLDPARLLAIANDFPIHIGLLATLVLLFSLIALIIGYRSAFYSPALLQVSCLTILVTYFLYTSDYVVPDYRSIGIVQTRENYQTANRFLVSWSPFVAILLSEGIARMFTHKWQFAGGMALGLVLLAQATIWAAPMTLPEYTSLRLRPGSEFPYLPMEQVIDYVSNDLAMPQSRILLSNNIGGFYFNNASELPGVWFRDNWAPQGQRTMDALLQYCTLNRIDIVVLPMIWMDSSNENQGIAESVLGSKDFKVIRTFQYLGRPAVLVVAFKGSY
jgi:hypothetical protein